MYFLCKKIEKNLHKFRNTNHNFEIRENREPIAIFSYNLLKLANYYLSVSRSNILSLKAYNNSHSYARRFLYCEQCLCRKKNGSRLSGQARRTRRVRCALCTPSWMRGLSCARVAWDHNSHFIYVCMCVIYIVNKTI